MAAGKPGVKYEYVTVKDKKSGAVKRVAMEQSKAQALRRKRSLAQTEGLIPKPLRGSVDTAGINDAVAAHIASLNAPLDQLKKEAQSQFDANLRANDQLGQQTQASLDQLLANADTRQRDYAALAGETVAAQQRANQAAAAGTASVLGLAYNPLVADRVQQGLDPVQAAQYAQTVQGSWQDRLGQQAQRDFFERGKGIQSITQQAFNEGQRRELAGTFDRIAAEQAANRQKRAELVRQFAQEDFTLASAFADAQAKAQQQAEENRLAAYNATTDRIKAIGGGGGGGGGGALSKDQLKAINKVQSDINKMVTAMHTPDKTWIDDNGTPDDTTDDQVRRVFSTAAETFPQTGGPWREAFARLTAGNVGVGAGKAALLASQWFPGSIKRSTPQKLVAMFSSRGVPTGVQKRILQQAGFGESAISAAMSGRPVYGPPAPASSKPKPRPTAPKAAVAFAKEMEKRYGGMRRIWGENEIIVLGVRARPDGRVEWQMSMKVPNGADKSKVFVTKVGQRPKFVGG